MTVGSDDGDEKRRGGGKLSRGVSKCDGGGVCIGGGCGHVRLAPSLKIKR